VIVMSTHRTRRWRGPPQGPIGTDHTNQLRHEAALAIVGLAYRRSSSSGCTHA
jgi:hypothetical protein